ncbi:cylicin-1-like [Helianthus annuus]|uniref:cylicin-1-like n=1 Tax=Helianthus annuus TaxID=4232 RepID=UPI000B8FC141|nr:cylicin-1-like [Helianthus annuus]
MDDIFLNPFSDMYAFSGSTDNNDTSSSNKDKSPPKERKKEAWESESAFGTFNKPPKLMAIEDYSRWATKFEDWMMAFAFPSWKSMKNGYANGKKNGEALRSTEEIDAFVAEQKCVALLFQSVREDIISLIDYSNAQDLWKKLKAKCIGSEEIVKNKKKLLRKEFDMFGCMKNESVGKMIERFGHLKLELVRHGINYPDDEIVDKLLKQAEEQREKSRALAVIYDDEGYDWSKEVLPEDDAIGYAFMASQDEPIPWKDDRTEEQKYQYRKLIAETKIIRLSEVEAEAEGEIDAEAEVNVEGDVRLSPNSVEFLKSLNAYNAEKEKAAGEEEGDDVEKSSSSSSDEEIDETERARRIKAEIEKEKQLKRKRREEKDDDVYVPSPKHVIESQTPPSGGRKKASARKRVVSPKAARKKLIVRLPKRTPKTKSSQPPSPPPEPSPPKSPHKSPPKQSTPPPSPPPHLSPLHISPPHLSPPHQTPIQEQPILTSQQIFQTPPSTQPLVQTTPGSSGYRTFPNIPEGISLEEIGDFGFANDEHVKRLEKKYEEVLIENKKLLDREKKLEKRVKSVEAENSSMLKKIKADQTDIDILKVKVAELEEEKAR